MTSCSKISICLIERGGGGNLRILLIQIVPLISDYRMQ